MQQCGGWGRAHFKWMRHHGTLIQRCDEKIQTRHCVGQGLMLCLTRGDNLPDGVLLPQSSQKDGPKASYQWPHFPQHLITACLHVCHWRCKVQLAQHQLNLLPHFQIVQATGPCMSLPFMLLPKVLESFHQGRPGCLFSVQACHEHPPLLSG